MHPKGTIYQYGKNGLHGEVRIAASAFIKLSYRLVRGLGAGLVGFAVIAALFTYGPVIREEASYRLGLINTFEFNDHTPSAYNLVEFAEADRITQVQSEAESFGVDSYYSIVVPKIGAASQVVANVDPGIEAEYSEALANGVAHAKGTYFPGQDKNIFLFSHSTDATFNVSRYNAVFYLLRKLEAGDSVIVYFADKKYEYIVEEKVVTSADDTSWLADVGDGEKLILQTCDPPGTTWKRLLVIARPV